MSAESVTCYFFRRSPGKIGVRVNVVLSPAQCEHFRIYKPQSLEKGQAARIAAWGAALARGDV